VSQQVRSTFVVREPSEVVQALVGLKDVRVLHYRRCGPDVELMIEQVVEQIRCPSCGGATQVKERPVVGYVDLPVYGTPMRLAWRKHRMRCIEVDCSRRSFVLQDHRIAAKGCLLTTRAAKWATVQVGGGRTVCEVAAELACDWHTVNDAVTIYGAALLAADRKRLTETRAIGLDETSFVRLSGHAQADYATTVADVEHHQIIDILPSRNYRDVAAFLDKQADDWKARIAFGALDMSNTYAAVYSVILPKAAQVVDAFHVITLANRALDTVRRRVQNEQTGHRGRRHDPLYRARRALLVGEERLDEKGRSPTHLTAHARRPERRSRDHLPGQGTAARVLPRTPPPGRCSPSSSSTADARRCPPSSASSARPSSGGSTRSATTTWPGSATARPKR
jgi:transposase